jgi:hypothetical protein
MLHLPGSTWLRTRNRKEATPDEQTIRLAPTGAAHAA